MVLINQPEIKTQRLLLRAFSPADAKEVEYLAGNNNVSKMTLNIPHPYKEGMAEEWISTHSSNWQNRDKVTYAVTDGTTRKLFGTVGFVSIKEENAVLGYWIGEQYWGKGYCTEAAEALIKFAYTNLGVVSVTAVHLSTNTASGRVMEKLGMRHIHSDYMTDRDGERAKIEVYELQIT